MATNKKRYMMNSVETKYKAMENQKQKGLAYKIQEKTRRSVHFWQSSHTTKSTENALSLKTKLINETFLPEKTSVLASSWWVCECEEPVFLAKIRVVELNKRDN